MVLKVRVIAGLVRVTFPADRLDNFSFLADDLFAEFTLITRVLRVFVIVVGPAWTPGKGPSHVAGDGTPLKGSREINFTVVCLVLAILVMSCG
jgi:hypothetical protein